MLEYAGLLYGILKDVISYNKYSIQELPVDRDYLLKSGIALDSNEKNIELHWSRPEKVPTRQIDGWDFYYGIDEKNKIKYKLRLKDLVLIARERNNI